MPFISDSFLKIKYKYAPFPKNLMDEAVRVNEKFLNEYQSRIEEHMSNEYLDIFRAYQNKHFSKRQLSNNFKESIFRDCKCKTLEQINDITLQTTLANMQNQIGMEHRLDDISGIMNNTRFGMIITPFVFSSSCAGSTLASTSSTGSTATTTGYIRATAIASGSTSDCYDEIALDCVTAAANYRLGVYDNDGAPNNLEAETGSHAAATGINPQSVTEWTLATALQYVANQSDNSSNVHGNYTGTSHNQSQAYGAFADPASTSTDTSPPYGQISHS